MQKLQVSFPFVFVQTMHQGIVQLVVTLVALVELTQVLFVRV